MSILCSSIGSNLLKSLQSFKTLRDFPFKTFEPLHDAKKHLNQRSVHMKKFSRAYTPPPFTYETSQWEILVLD